MFQYMNSSLKYKLEQQYHELPGFLMGICLLKNIEVIDGDNFVLNDRKVILDYHTLTGDYKGIIKNMINGKVTLNENQLEKYQSKDFVRRNKDNWEQFAHWDNSCPCCNDLEY
jgi:hypothetical protein